MEGTHLSILLHDSSEKAKLEAMLTPDQSTSLELKVVNIVQGMTARGRTGMIFQMIDQNGKKYHFNTSARIIVNGVAPAGSGFMIRVGDNPMLP